MSKEKLMEKIVALCKRRGFVYPSSDIYGGLANSWDYGPYGVELKNNVKAAWWKDNVHNREDMVGLDAGIIMHSRTWDASGHTENFNDILVDCKKCKARLREDHIKGKCPKCGSQKIAEIQFGLLRDSEELQKDMDAGKIVGGAVI